MNTVRKTKIIATIGPASSTKQKLEELMDAGVNVCRLNFSHGTHGDHLKVLKNIRTLNAAKRTHFAILADLQGPKLRVGIMPDAGVELVEGKELILTNKECDGSAERIYMNYKQLPKDVIPGENILMDDGKLKVQVVSTDKKENVVTKVVHGGILTSKKGVNLPDTAISQPSLTKKDLEDLEFALAQDVDWVALSFVRSARDIIELRHHISSKNSKARIIAKIEKPEAVDDIEDIIKETDAVMVARGDLGVEIPMERVPLAQKKIVNLSLQHAKPVIIATQMMESMIGNASPTRAEVNDVANAVMDGADAVMLSGETSVGKYPVEVIKCMDKILREIEEMHENLYYRETVPEKNEERFITDSICYNACRLATRVDARAIITMTHSGYTAFKLSSQRPRANVFVFSNNKKLLSLMHLVWGVRAFYYDKMVSTDHTVADIKYLLKKKGYLETGDLIINTASMPIEDKGATNMLKLSSIE